MVTHVVTPDFPYLEVDAVVGMKARLIGRFHRVDSPSEAEALGFAGPFWRLD